jgi:anti-anti-sigma factor
METRAGIQQGRLVLHVTGRIDSLTASSFETQVDAAIKSCNNDIILDFSGVTYISSAGLRSLLVLSKKLQTPVVRNIVLCGLKENIVDVIRITGFLILFKIYMNLDAALAGNEDALVV